ncbi:MULTISPECIES: sigma-70 family RNA polymerase sigma factor [Actinosynnema]|uniref:RNA polymerase sigma factor n=1 Tax=Actinosynnema TaxID=40566 RepID=UPI0020A4506A|nr:sigma-70 family RNA polymerase sigma factor [Actinosynnema pretiosum]MCP2098384.1 RNA polymerase sigma factor, sigma-70 family [Actinosynnema pretiosum]
MTPARPVAALVGAAAEGDRGAWDQIVERYTPLVFSVVSRHRLRPADGADVNQVVWLRLVEQIGRLRDPAALPGWIVTTARNECLRVLRAQQRLLPFDPADEESAVADGEDLDARLVDAERLQALRDGFGALPEQCRRLLARLLADPPPSYAALGAELGVPVGSVGPTRLRCLEKLRRTEAVARLLSGGSVEDPVGGALGVGKR